MKSKMKPNEIVSKVVNGAHTLHARASVAIAGFMFTPVLASANEYDFLGNGDKSGMFSGVTAMVEDGGSGLYAVAKKGAIVWLMIAIILVAVGLGSSNSNKVQAAKDRAGWVFIAGAIIFGAMGLVGLASSVGATFAGSVN